MVTIAGYEISHKIYESQNSLIYRGCRLEGAQPVILKVLNNEYPTPEQIARFRLEYEIAHNLDVTGIIRPYRLEQYQHTLAIVMEDFGGEALSKFLATNTLSLDNFFSWATQIADILGQIHRQHVIHKDINPSNIALNPQTGQVKIIDFGIATILSRENPTFRNPNVLEGTLAYISPEQTGRMNRAIDYRTDFYSLGATFYELLTGQLPFPGPDALELVHCHIAKYPLPPHQLNRDVPQALSDVVMKLLAKNAEERYQSMAGLKADLEECWRQWQTTGRIEAFALGRHDSSDRFQIPQKLYGREQEIDLLLAAFERVAAGIEADSLSGEGGDRIKENAHPSSRGPQSSELMLVSGYAGIGKTALVQEVYKPLTRQHGYFISGKFDQFQRNIPYSSLIQAFRALIRQLLTESESQIAAWREKLLAALGPNGQVILEVIPEVELIIGPQPAIPALPPTEAQNRFNLVLQNFIRVFTQPEHPLVLFLDDLQWADGASLKLLQLLLSAPERQALFFIGAYRDNEVSAAHPLNLTLEAIQKEGRVVNHMTLTPLELPDVNQFIADALACLPNQTRSLAELVWAKTGGNPFFMQEFLKSLYREGLIEKGGGQWDLAQIKAKGMTDNVVELMASKVQNLNLETQQALKLAACIGNQFDLKTLAIVHQKSAQATASDLREALQEGLILPLNDAYRLMEFEVEGLTEALTVEYKFAHDRIQQAVYSLIPALDKQAVHCRVGRLLLQRIPPDQRESKIFDLVNQLNLGTELIAEAAEKVELAQLNLLAGQKAKTSVAYEPALNYFRAGLGLLTPDSWHNRYDLTLALYVEAVEAAYLSGDLEQMEQWETVALHRAAALLDKVKIYEIKIAAYLAQTRLMEAINTALEVLKLLGLKFPTRPNKAHILLGLLQTKARLTGKPIERLIDLPEMTQPDKLAAMRIIGSAMGATYYAAPNLFVLLTLSMIDLSLKYGNTPLSIYAYSLYGIILCGAVGDIKAGYQFGQLALQLFERLNAVELKAKVLLNVNTFTRHWREHVRGTIPPLLEVYWSGLETGDLAFAAFGGFVYSVHSYFAGLELAQLEREMVHYGDAIKKIKQTSPFYQLKIYHQAVLNLLGQSDQPCYLSGDAYDEETMLPLHLEANNKTLIFILYLNKLILCYLFQAYPQALESVVLAEKYAEAGVASVGVPIVYFYGSLIRLALLAEAVTSEQKRFLKQVAANQKKLQTWARHAPMNCLHKFYLVEAERARILGRHGEAREFYDQAIALARDNEYLQEEALAHELAAKFYLGRAQTDLAFHYLRNARYAYQRWGALAKVKDLEHRYTEAFARGRIGSAELPTRTTPTASSSSENVARVLDLISVLKASQAISGEIVLAQLLEKLMKIVIENAGAQTGYLLLEQKGHWVIKAEAKIEGEARAEIKALQAAAVAHHGKLSPGIVNYVARTREAVVLNDASREGMFTNDFHVTQNQPKSVLCLPLLNQGKLNGILYLENNLTTAAFTPERQEVLSLLSSQAAISIENATLYTHQVELTSAAARFVPFEFLQFLNKHSITEAQLGDQTQQEVAILVSDIRSFTTLSETMTPQENFNFVNAYLGYVSPLIRQQHGFIIKYMGDGIMAIFPRRVDDALITAIQQLQQVAAFNVERQQRGELPIQVGIGIHAGKTMLGFVGEAERLQADLLADAVNLAARLEGLTKMYGASIIISQEVLARLEDPTRFKLRFLGKVQVKGRQEAVAVFEVFEGDPEEIIQLKMRTRMEFETGLSLYHSKRFAEATEMFQTVLHHNSQDKTAQLYLERATRYLKDGVPADWSGVAVLTEK